MKLSTAERNHDLKRKFSRAKWKKTVIFQKETRIL